WNAVARRGRSSKWGFAASMGETPLRSHSATRSASTMSHARRSACRSPASRLPRQRSAKPRRRRREDKPARHIGRDMSENATGADASAPAVSQERLQQAEAYGEAEEGVVNRLFGWAGRLVTSIAVAMSLFHLYAAIAGAWPFTDFPIITTQPLRYAHVAFVLMLSFLLFPLSERFRNRIRWWDIAAGIIGAAILVYAIEGGEEFTDRATMPTHLDVLLGVIFIVLL